MQLMVRSERVVLPDGVRPASIHIRDGRIVASATHDDRAGGVPEIDAGELVVMPGPRRHPRAHQRARPDGLGRLRAPPRARRRPAA